MKKEKISEDVNEADQVMSAVEGTVVSWEHKTQIHPTTGAVYDFHGNLILAPVAKEGVK